MTEEVDPLVIRDLRLRVRSRGTEGEALRGVDLTVRKGEVLALVGESGSGKSLTARCAMGDYPPGTVNVRGSIALGGSEVTSMNAEELRRARGSRAAMIFQDPLGSLNPSFRVGSQLVASIRRHTGKSKTEAEQIGVALLEEMQIPQASVRFKQYPHQLSGGMRQRVVAAIALSGNPDLLIADEPTTALDVTVEAAFLALLANLRKSRNLSVLFITHDLSIVRAFADRVAVMYGGRVVENGDVSSVFANPAHPYTAALMRSMPTIEGIGQQIPIIPGRPPSVFVDDVGCRFRPRCDVYQAVGEPDDCASTTPPLVRVGRGRTAACHHPSFGATHEEERVLGANR